MSSRALHADKLVQVVSEMTREWEAERGSVSSLILSGAPFETWWKQSLLASFAAHPWRRMPGRQIGPGVGVAIDSLWQPVDQRCWPGRSPVPAEDRERPVDLIVRVSRSGKRAHLLDTHVLNGRSPQAGSVRTQIVAGATSLRSAMALRATASAWSVILAHGFRGGSHLRGYVAPLVNEIPGLRAPLLFSVARSGGGERIWIVGMRFTLSMESGLQTDTESSEPGLALALDGL